MKTFYNPYSVIPKQIGICKIPTKMQYTYSKKYYTFKIGLLTLMKV